MAQQTTARGAAGKEARDAAARGVNGMSGVSGVTVTGVTGVTGVTVTGVTGGVTSVNGAGGNGARSAKPRSVARQADRAERTDRMERTERTSRTERAARPERTGRAERTERTGRAPRPEPIEPGAGASGSVLVKGAVAPIPVRSSSARTAARIPPVGELKLGWQERASCQQAEAAAFFAPDSERIREREKREAAAKRVCDACPVRTACLEHALAVPEQFGIWGGMTELERQDEARRRRGAANAGSRPVVLPIRLGARDLGAQAGSARDDSEVAA